MLKKLQWFIPCLLALLSVGVLGQSPGDLVISEFMANPQAVLDANGEYVEFYNNTSNPVDINGFTLRDDGVDSHVIANGGPLVVPAFGFIVLGVDANSGTNGGYSANYQYDNFVLGNSGDEIVLETSGGTEICRLNYTNGDPFGAGVSAELSNVTLHSGGVTQEGSYVAATSPYGDGDLGSPGSAGNTQGTGGGDPPPAISNIARDLFIPEPGTALMVTADITDDSDVAAAELRWSVDGGAMQAVAMTGPVGDTWTGVISGSEFSDGQVLEYWIWAEDDAPQSAESEHTQVYVGDTPIANLHINDPNGVPLYRLAYARVTGVATVGNSTFSVDNLDVYLQDNSGGVNLFQFGADSLVTITVGNSYTVVGKLDHYNGKTEIIPDDPETDITDNGASTLPDPFNLSIAALLADPETYEGRLVLIEQVSNTGNGAGWPVENSDANLEITDDGGTSLLILRIDGDTDIDGSPEPAWPVNVQGVFNQFDNSSPYNSGYQLLPRSLEDIDVTVGIEPLSGGVANGFKLHPNYPNPFNPATTLRFEVPANSGTVTLAIYNALGQKLKTLVQERLASGAYEVQWRGDGDNGQSAPSGIYFAVLKANGQELQRAKMVLLK